ncbi:MAG TPA: hypothetical protein VNM68_02665, partial [Candidatus Polarisedimenticolia bacterium]|nr:hypothetical protein [Candidatus Polarisedimenticolia bacterium]
MPATLTPAHRNTPTQTPAAHATAHPAADTPSLPAHAAQTRPSTARPSGLATDDEILGLDSPGKSNTPDPQLAMEFDEAGTTDASPEAADAAAAAPAAWDTNAEPENLRAVFDANPDLRRAWHESQAYRETFATPEEARAATVLLADLDRMDALFFSRRPEDHAELARAVAQLDPEACASLAQAMQEVATGSGRAQASSSDGLDVAQRTLARHAGHASS